MSTAIRPMPAQESSHDRSAQRARSYDGLGSSANPSAARSSWPRWSRTLFDHIGRSRSERWRDREPDRFGGLEVDDEVPLARRLDRQIPGFRAFQDFVHIYGGPAPQFVEVSSVSHEKAVLSPLPYRIDSRYPALDREVGDLSDVRCNDRRLRHNEEPVGALLINRGRGAVEMVRSPYLQGTTRQARGRRRSLGE